MPSQRRFEGPILEDLLDTVRDEVGDGARILAANRIRKGGVGGFFAKEHYEVVVELPPSADPNDVPDRTFVAPAPPAAPAPVELDPSPRRVPASILDLAEAVNDEERELRGTTMIDLADDEDDGPYVDDDRDFDEHEILVEDDDIAVVDATPAEDVKADPKAFAALLARAAQNPALTDDVQARLTTQATNARQIATRPAPIAPLAPQRIPIDDFDVLHDTAAPTVFKHAPSNGDDVIERTETTLRKLGVPARLVPRGLPVHELRGALVENLSHLPPAPVAPDAKGVVVCVVGPGTAPVVLARELAEEQGIDPDRVVLSTSSPIGDGVPSWLQVNDVATAQERRRSWHRRAQPTFVAVALTPGRQDMEWARNILDHLEPTITWAIVPAGWKGEDTLDWANGLGGIDALALTRLDETVSPAAVLELGIPVGRLDGRRANAVSWSEILLDRLTR